LRGSSQARSRRAERGPLLHPKRIIAHEPTLIGQPVDTLGSYLSCHERIDPNGYATALELCHVSSWFQKRRVVPSRLHGDGRLKKQGQQAEGGRAPSEHERPNG